MSWRRAFRTITAGLGLVGIVAACTPAPPTTVPFHHQAAGEPVGDVAAEVSGDDKAPIRSVQNLSDRELATIEGAIRARLERSRVDHYPRVEQLHIVPGPTPDSAVFLAKVRIAGFTPSDYGMIGHYDRRTGVITALETKRPWRIGAELTDWPFPGD